MDRACGGRKSFSLSQESCGFGPSKEIACDDFAGHLENPDVMPANRKWIHGSPKGCNATPSCALDSIANLFVLSQVFIFAERHVHSDIRKQCRRQQIDTFCAPSDEDEVHFHAFDVRGALELWELCEVEEREKTLLFGAEDQLFLQPCPVFLVIDLSHSFLFLIVLHGDFA